MRVYAQEEYSKSHRLQVALFSLAQGRNQRERITKWAAGSQHPAQASAVADLPPFSPGHAERQREIAMQVREAGYAGLEAWLGLHTIT
eukprot:15461895-Alexandrium_andersonii.AAC.1